MRFIDEVVSDVFFVREKYARHEVPDLFYTHDESLKFTSDYNRESVRAEALGMTWYDWWEARTDEDVARDDAQVRARITSCPVTYSHHSPWWLSSGRGGVARRRRLDRNHGRLFR